MKYFHLDHDHDHLKTMTMTMSMTMIMTTMTTWPLLWRPWWPGRAFPLGRWEVYISELSRAARSICLIWTWERGVSSFGFKFFSLWIWMCDHTHCNCHKVSSFMTLVEPNGFLFHIWLCVCVSPSHASSRLNFGCKFCDLARCWLGRGHHSRGVTPNRHFWIIFLFVLVFVVWSIIVFAQC